jgi:hypothetical protein
MDFAAVCKARRVDEILISSARIAGPRLSEIWEACSAEGIIVSRMRLQLERISGPTSAVSGVSLADGTVPDHRAAV